MLYYILLFVSSYKMATKIIFLIVCMYVCLIIIYNVFCDISINIIIDNNRQNWVKVRNSLKINRILSCIIKQQSSIKRLYINAKNLEHSCSYVSFERYCSYWQGKGGGKRKFSGRKGPRILVRPVRSVSSCSSSKHGNS